jgi:glutathione synthase/RimK-type ligase-like ATP-grasp enzyme
VSGWLVVVDRLGDLDVSANGTRAMTTRDYATRPELLRGRPPKVINLARSYAYQTMGYYASLLAEARGHKVLPTVDVIRELAERSLWHHDLAGLEDELTRLVHRLQDPPEGRLTLLIACGVPHDRRFERVARLVFDRFRCPLLELQARIEEGATITRLRPAPLHKLDLDQRAFVEHAIERFTRASWRTRKARPEPRHVLAVLHDPKEALPPSRPAGIERLRRVAEPMGLGVETIGRRDLARLPEYDALWIRETTSIESHTFRFAKRAQQEGMPVIDDPISILRCTNKVYLAELMAAHGIPMPRSMVIGSLRRLDEIAATFGFPVVLKVPDASFSRGVHKADDARQLRMMAARMLEESDLIVAQEFMYTSYDWRIGVLGGEALFAVQYLMARNHWQIIAHGEGGRMREGGFRAVPVEAAPEEVVRTALRAARPIGDGLYGVDLKQNERGVFVIEINDNPNLDHGIEDSVLKDELWRRLAGWFLARLQ